MIRIADADVRVKIREHFVQATELSGQHALDLLIAEVAHNAFHRVDETVGYSLRITLRPTPSAEKPIHDFLERIMYTITVEKIEAVASRETSHPSYHLEGSVLPPRTHRER